MTTETAYRANGVRLKATREQGEDLRDLARRCSALWNVANYLCRQRFFSEDEKVPGYTALCAELKSHPIYRSLPSDVSQEVLKKVAEAWSSYWALRRAWKAGTLMDKPGLPRYRKNRRTEEYREDWIPIKHPRSYEVSAHEVSLTLPHDLRTKHAGRLEVSYSGQRRHGGKQGRAEVQFDRAKNRWYFRWSVEQLRREDRSWERAAAIDLGVRIPVSLSIEGEHVAVHYSGREMLRDFDYWGRRIAEHQRELAHRQKRSSKRLRRMHAMRRARLEHAWEAIAADIAQRLKRAKVGVVYIGHPKGILRDRRYGRWSERIHNFWSFDLATRILAKHLRRARIRVERVNERGSSSTCPLDPTPAKRTHRVVRKPRHRLTCRTCGHSLHSDQAGSQNILRFEKPSVRGDGLEASPRTETLRWNRHRWVDSENQRRSIARPRAA